jgi:hypothetical protein
MSFFDGNVSKDGYSVVGRRVEIAGLPFIGIGNLTGGGVTKEGQAYVRGSDGRILFLSQGIKTPQDLTTEITLGSARELRQVLEVQAASLGMTQPMAWMDVPVTFVNQIASANILAPSWAETMTLSVLSWVQETPGDGSGSKKTIVWKQENLPQLG